MNDNLPNPSNEQRIRALERQIRDLVTRLDSRQLATRPVDTVRLVEVVDPNDAPLSTTEVTRTGAQVDARFYHTRPDGVADVEITPRSASEQIRLGVAAGDNPAVGDIGFSVRIDAAWYWLAASAGGGAIKLAKANTANGIIPRDGADCYNSTAYPIVFTPDEFSETVTLTYDDTAEIDVYSWFSTALAVEGEQLFWYVELDGRNWIIAEDCQDDEPSPVINAEGAPPP